MSEGILFEYDQILLGNRRAFSNFYFDLDGKDAKQKVALTVIRYACEYYLRWEPEDVYEYLNEDIINLMKLNLVMGYIQWPIELEPKEDYFYIACLLYPKKYPITAKELALRIYKKVLSGKLSKFPKEYLSESQGFMRACICLQYMITEFMQFSSVESMYQCFASAEGVRALKKYRLFAICTELFPEPIDYLHMSLSTAQQNDFFYHYYKFMRQDGAQIRKLKKNKQFII